MRPDVLFSASEHCSLTHPVISSLALLIVLENTAQMSGTRFCQPYREGVVFLPVQWLLAPNDSSFIINLKQILGLLVHPGSLQLVDHFPRKDFVRLDLRQGEEMRFMMVTTSGEGEGVGVHTICRNTRCEHGDCWRPRHQSVLAQVFKRSDYWSNERKGS